MHGNKNEITCPFDYTIGAGPVVAGDIKSLKAYGDIAAERTWHLVDNPGKTRNDCLTQRLAVETPYRPAFFYGLDDVH